MHWTLRTATSEYVVGLFGETGSPQALALEYWGAAGGATGPWPKPAIRYSYETPADLAPLEYASNGTRHVHRSELLVEHDDGLSGAVWTYVSHEQSATELAVLFRDDTGRLELVQHVLVRPDSDVVERWVDVRNVSTDHEVRLGRVLSAAWSVHAPDGAVLHYPAGSWSHEFGPEAVPLRQGVLQIGSRYGVTGHLHAPAMTVTVPGRADAFGVQLAWSGSWTIAAEADPGGLLRVSAGIDDETTTVRLTPGRTFTTPRSWGVWSPDGEWGVARAWHRHQRLVNPRATDPYHRPIVYNSWFATRFDLRADHQLELARTAAELGVEAFVIDDGWFGTRSSDRSGLGDWTVRRDAFPDGLLPLATAVTELGMRFGLWVELEGVNLDSDLYRAHPDWVYRVGDRPLVTMRHQTVLNLGLTAVRSHLAGVLRRLLTELPITYLKWDLNRPITDPGPADSEWSVAHTEGYYGLLRLLRDEFPHVTVEACAGGGGRVDTAVAELADVVWTSDETGPRDRLVIQDGFLRAFGAHLMSGWVTDLPGSRFPEPVSDGFRLVTSMAGVLGFGADLGTWDAARRKAAADAVALYKELRPVLLTGDVHVHGSPRSGEYALEYVTPQRSVKLVWAASDADVIVTDREGITP
ncbi:alpha-galactosidase [Jiangella mangrovi]|uniref:alpha-galactosidase n=1 Tax=Jiangella mangrovi TaxID=1524084 RepID=A0A7W9LIX1_9ACTN|nr:alpha-galactosidase [Jiangella mangrovi]